MKGETNMKAKRLLTLLLALAMTTGLVACGGFLVWGMFF